MCKFCNGTVEPKSNKFMHEKHCTMNVQPKPEPEVKQDKVKKSKKAGKLSDHSTLNSSMNTQGDMQDEDRVIEEFARKMELISKQPPMRFVNNGRRRRRLKPNVSNDWLNGLKKQIQQQSCDGTQIDSNDSESQGATSLNSGTNSLDTKKPKLKDMTADHIQVPRKKGKK